MTVILPAMSNLALTKKAPGRYQEIPSHIYFDVKMEFARKASFVAG
jgi:hypothetical protein